MAKIHFLLLCFMLAAFVGISESSFYDDASDMVNSFDATFKTRSKDCSNIGKNKAKSLNLDEDEYLAAVLVNIYTQTCKLENGHMFYSELNKNIKREPYNEFARLLKESLAILSKKDEIRKLQLLYRGQCDVFPNQGKKYTADRFLSTSINFKTSFNFAKMGGSGCIVLIENGKGTQIDRYSESPHEEEVLLSYGTTFIVKEKTKDTQAILKKLREFDEKLTDAKMKGIHTLVVLRQQTVGKSALGFYQLIV